MATTTQQEDSKAGEFSINTQAHGYPEGPDHVHVEISPVRRDMLMAILAAGVDGRYSFDFSVSASGVDIKRAYVEGMREPVEKLPAWVEPIRERIVKELEG